MEEKKIKRRGPNPNSNPYSIFSHFCIARTLSVLFSISLRCSCICICICDEDDDRDGEKSLGKIISKNAAAAFF